LPALSRAQSLGRQISCLNNLRQLQIAWLGYAHDWQDFIPVNNSTGAGTNNAASLGVTGIILGGPRGAERQFFESMGYRGRHDGGFMGKQHRSPCGIATPPSASGR